MAKVLDCDIIESEFELQSQYYVHLRTNSLWKKYETPLSFLL